MSEADSDFSKEGSVGSQELTSLYGEVRRLARQFMARERDDHTLQPTALANEAWLRLFGTTTQRFATGEAFLAAAVTALRRILVEHARSRGRRKRGGDLRRIAADAEQIVAPLLDERVVALDEALEKLATFDPTKARLVELRFFGGLSVEEAAAVIGSSPRTAARDWRVARAFLRSELATGADDGELDS